MELEFETRQMTSAMKAVKKMFDKGPYSETDVGGEDCLVAVVNDGTAMLESACGGLYAKAMFPADVREAGRLAINRTCLHALKLQGDRSTFTHKTGTNRLKFKSGQFTGELAVGEAFDAIEAARPPSIPELSIQMPALVAKAAAKRTCLNATLDTLLRMRLTVEGKQMTLSCNDNFRAAAVRTNLDEDSHGEGEIDVPAVFFNTVLQSIEDTRVHLGFNEQYFRVCGGGFDICHTVMQEPEKPMVDVFAKVEGYRADEPVVIATVDTGQLRDAIASVTSVAPSSGEVKLEMMFGEKNGGQLTTAVRSATSRGKFNIPVRSLQVNSRVPVNISAKYLLEMLNLLSSDEMSFCAWERVIVLQAEKVGCCMIMPQLKSREE